MKSKLAITLASSAMLAGGCHDATNQPSQNLPANSPSPPSVGAGDFLDMGKDKVKELLAWIGLGPARQDEVGATCYMTSNPPHRVEYVCPNCGEKTIRSEGATGRWDTELILCRRLFKELPKREAMTLEEAGFCRKCFPNTNRPSLNLLVRFHDGATNKMSGITSQDLRLLQGLLSGSVSFATPNFGTARLTNALPRLSELRERPHE